MSARQVRFLVLTALSVLIVAALLLTYLKAVSPVKEEVDKLTAKIEADMKMLEAIGSQINEQIKLSKEESLQLQRQVPLESFVDQLIVNVKSVEQSSGNTINSIGVSYSEISLDDWNKINSTADAPAAEESKADSPLFYKVSLGMAVQSPSYERMRQFIMDLEGLERIVNVDTLSFDSAADAYQLTVSVYYAPPIDGIEERLPRAVFPGPGGKTNPINIDRKQIEETSE